jgi:Flp pilus assembly protein TadG
MSFLKDKRGQVILIIALMMPILILAAALALDSGNAFVTKSRLTKSVDAACLAGMKNLAQGQSTANTIATHIFNANYGAGAPTPTITFPTDAYGDQQVHVVASTNVQTTFAKLLFPTWKVADAATATRGKLVMALVLDNTGSLLNNGGAAAVKNAVPTFVNYFDDTNDNVSLITFGKTMSGNTYTTSTVNFAMATNFKSTITADINGLSPGGGTFGTGGTYVSSYGPPIALADNQIASVPVVSGANTVRVMVYFTDGLVNALQDTFTCYTDATHTTQVLVNYGGYDAPASGFGNLVDTFQASTGTDWCTSTSGAYGHCTTDGATNSNSIGIAYKSGSSPGNLCQNPFGTSHYVTNFPAHGGQTTISRANITTEAQYRALQSANAMRAENPGIFVFTIGLGTDTSTQTFLKQVANDPASPTYNANLPQGEFFAIGDCTKVNCTAQMETAFQIIAAKVLLRLTE